LEPIRPVPPMTTIFIDDPPSLWVELCSVDVE
jgi:hypothetical protein